MESKKESLRKLAFARSKDRRLSGGSPIEDVSGPISKGVVESGGKVSDLTQNAGSLAGTATSALGAASFLASEQSDPLSGGLSGAMAGAKFGPTGALIGGGLGLAKGLIGAKSAKRKAKAKAEADLQNKKGEIAGQQAAGVNKSLSGLSQALSATLARR